MAEGMKARQASAYDRARELYENLGVHSGFDVIGTVLSEARQDLDRLTRLAVGRAARRGEPWSRIGPVLGVTRQAAQQRYGSSSAA